MQLKNTEKESRPAWFKGIARLGLAVISCLNCSLLDPCMRGPINYI